MIFHLFHLFWLFSSIFGLILPKFNNFNKFCYYMTQRRNKGSTLDRFVFKTNLLLVILRLHACAKSNLWLGTGPNVFNKTERGPYASRVADPKHLPDCLNPNH